MKRWNVKEGIDIYLAVTGFYNAYLIVSDTYSCVVDTARRKTFSSLENSMQKVLPNGHLDYLVLTHTHYDHCENAALLQQNWNAKVLVSRSEAAYLKEGSTPLPRGTNIFTYILSAMGNRFATHWYYYDKVTPEIEIDGEYTLLPGIKIIPTPGHSVGSQSVVIDNQFAIVGDAMFGSPGESVLPHFADDKKQMFKTWSDLLKNTECHTFLPGHGKPISRTRLEREVEKLK